MPPHHNGWPPDEDTLRRREEAAEDFDARVVQRRERGQAPLRDSFQRCAACGGTFPIPAGTSADDAYLHHCEADEHHRRYCDAHQPKYDEEFDFSWGDYETMPES